IGGSVTVVLDARVCNDHFPGIGRYTSALARALVEVSPDLDLALLESRSPRRMEIVAPGVRRIPSSATPFSIRQQWEIPGLLARSRAALFHSPYYLMPYAVGMPTVLTIYDFIPYRFPQYFSATRRAAIHMATGLAVLRADRFLAISQATKDDLC